jgi:hypothetical protein
MIAELDIADEVTGIAPEVYELKEEAAVRRLDITWSEFALRLTNLVGRWKELYNQLKNLENDANFAFSKENLTAHCDNLTKMRNIGCDMIILLQMAEDASGTTYDREQTHLRFGIRMLTLVESSLRYRLNLL